MAIEFDAALTIKSLVEAEARERRKAQELTLELSRLRADLEALTAENESLRLDLKVAHREMQRTVGHMQQLQEATIKLLKVLEKDERP